MFAAPIDMEPGMAFVVPGHPSVLVFAGVERVSSRFPGRRRVRVLVARGGVPFVVDRARRFMVVNHRDMEVGA